MTSSGMIKYLPAMTAFVFGFSMMAMYLVAFRVH